MNATSPNSRVVFVSGTRRYLSMRLVAKTRGALKGFLLAPTGRNLPPAGDSTIRKPV
jgi:hypothetical protein